MGMFEREGWRADGSDIESMEDGARDWRAGDIEEGVERDVVVLLGYWHVDKETKI